MWYNFLEIERNFKKILCVKIYLHPEILSLNLIKTESCLFVSSLNLFLAVFAIFSYFCSFLLFLQISTFQLFLQFFSKLTQLLVSKAFSILKTVLLVFYKKKRSVQTERFYFKCVVAKLPSKHQMGRLLLLFHNKALKCLL